MAAQEKCGPKHNGLKKITKEELNCENILLETKMAGQCNSDIA